MRALRLCWVPLTAAALLAPVSPPTVASSRHLAETLQSLDHALETLQPGASAAGGDPAPLVNACLAVCRALPGAQGVAAIPEDAVMLREAAAFFDWESADGLGQHLFDASLWDDALEALASNPKPKPKPNPTPNPKPNPKPNPNSNALEALASNPKPKPKPNPNPNPDPDLNPNPSPNSQP